MEMSEYLEFYAESLKQDEDFTPVEIDTEPLPGEDIEDTYMRWLKENEFVVIENGYVYYDIEKINAYNPNLGKVLETIALAETYSTLDSLEDKGLVTTGVDEEGNIVYHLTDTGREKFDFSLF